VNFVDGGEPPMLLLHGAADTTVHAEDSEILAERVRSAGGDADLRLYPDVGHVRILAVLAAPLRWLGDTATDVAAFLRRQQDDRP
jgi:acetyl esterase/lipase